MWDFGKSRKRQKRALLQNSMRRMVRGEMLESRAMMAANPLHVGVTYVETDDITVGQGRGTDLLPDRFLLSFIGGEPNTELKTLTINTDKDGNGFTTGEPIFDTALTGRGTGDAHPFKIESITAADPRASVTGTVDDGGMLLTLEFAFFRSGDTVEFSLDVDEIAFYEPGFTIPEFNSELDEVASGKEFERSILTATFTAPHYEDATAQSIFLDKYGDPRATFGLNLPADSGELQSAPNRTAAAVASTVQTPKPISISGTVFLDDNLNLVRETGETLLSGVLVSLWKKDANGQYVDTGRSTTTDAQGRYEFGTELGLLPGDYQVIETQPTGLFSVGAIPGIVDGVNTGSALTKDILTEISIPLGDLHAINYDFAEARPAAISGFVYRDDSDDGIRDPGEPGLPGVQIRLEPISTISNQLTLTTVTLGDGSYEFRNLSPGEYRVVEVTQPLPFTDGLDTAGTVNGITVGAAVNPGDQIQGIQLVGGSQGIEYNFGELPLGTLSGFVYVARPGEDCEEVDFGDWIPVTNAIVRLYDSAGNQIRETRTGDDGSYRFLNLPKGEYRIEEETPAGLIEGSAHVGMIDGVMVGIIDNAGDITRVRLPAGKDGTRYDFCKAAPAKVEGYVYHDASNDGSRDPGESGIRNATVNLYDSNGQLVDSTTTNEVGFYQFANLLPGNYRIEEITPQGFLDGLDRAGTVAGLVVGSATNPGDRISNVVLKQGQAGIEYNFGELLPASIEGRVHVDIDNDCELDPNEQTLEGVVMRLLDAGGNEIARTTTNMDGIYRFTGLRPGKYSVVQVQPEGFFSGGQKAGSTGGDASVENEIRNTILVSGSKSINNDFCENPPSELSGRVHADRDGDCEFDPGEPLLENVRIDLLDSTGRVVATTLTNANGRYEFKNLRAGQYTVRETQPVGFLQGGQKAGSKGGNATQQDLISEIEIGWGETLIDYDFCELEPASISGVVFIDSDGDCVNEPEIGETPLAGVAIRLHDSTGRIIATTVTNSMGRYRFDNLMPGEYQVSEVQPDGLFHGGQTVGSGGGIVAGDDLLTQIQVMAADNLVNYDFCEVEPSSIAGFVFVDTDRDCEYEPSLGERPLEGVTIELRDASNRVVATTTTNSLGQYRFENLRAGNYTVFERQPAGFFHGGQTVGSGGGVVAGQDLISEIQLGPGQDLVDYDFCEVEPSSISGRVWSDNNINRTFDIGEPPITNVQIELINENGVVISTMRTDTNGMYKFDNLSPGKYSVRESQPIGFFHVGQIAGSHGGNATVTDLISEIMIPGGTDLINYDFPEAPPATISGFVFQDGPALIRSTAPDPTELRLFRDGKFTSDDTPIAGVTMQLRLRDGSPAMSNAALPGTYADGPIEVVTDENGYYEFTGLRSQSYSVYQIQPEGFVDALDTEGTLKGLAVNAADLANDPTLSFLVQTLSSSPATDPNFDAILLVDVFPNNHSRLNNFSEIKLDPPTFIPPGENPPEKSNDPPAVGFDTFNAPPQLYLASIPTPFKPLELGTWASGVTWHLSVINAGTPRGVGLGNDSVMRQASASDATERWSSEAANNGQWRLFELDGTESKAKRVTYIGVVDGIPLVGDFNGDGIEEVAIYVNGEWLIDLNGDGAWDQGDLWVQLGTELDRPVVGDWDGDGKDDVGIFGPEWERDAVVIPTDPGLPDPDNRIRRGMKNTPPPIDEATDGRRWLQKTAGGNLRADIIDHVFRYGTAADAPMAGDWNGDGVDAIAIFRSGQWLLDLDGDGRWTDRDEVFDFGQPGDIPIAADFNGDGIDELAVVRGDVWIIDSDGDRRLTAADATIRIEMREGEVPVAGDWDGDGRAEPGYYRVRENQVNASDPAA
jgi:serine-aspartate repeat-containing protein C/D/E